MEDNEKLAVTLSPVLKRTIENEMSESGEDQYFGSSGVSVINLLPLRFFRLNLINKKGDRRCGR